MRKNGNKDLLIKWLERDLIFHIQVKRFLWIFLKCRLPLSYYDNIWNHYPLKKKINYMDQETNEYREKGGVGI